MTYIARDNVLDLVNQYDEDLTKDSQAIIESHKAFFDGLTEINQVVVIGHSLSAVDWDYFTAVNEVAPNANWYFGIFDWSNLRNLSHLATEMGWKKYHVFRTDCIWTKPNREGNRKTAVDREPRPRVFLDGNTTVTAKQYYDLTIGEGLDLVLPDQVRKAVFLDDFLCIVLQGLAGSILLFGKKDQQRDFIAGLEGFEHQGLLNRRLNRVF